MGANSKMLPFVFALIGSSALAGDLEVSRRKVDLNALGISPSLESEPDLRALKAEYRRPDSIPFPEDNPYTAHKAHLGKLLFFDPRLSRSGIQSCSSCHNPSFAWADGLSMGVGDHMISLARRTPTILNSAWGEMFAWDGAARTLEEQALNPIRADDEMNMPLDRLIGRLEGIDEYRVLFGRVFPDTGITPGNIAKAIATFERTVVSATAPFDSWIAGDETAISAEAKRGFELFNEKARCSACHSGWRFTDDSFHDVGLRSDDLGRGVHLPEIQAMAYAFKTPGLRNIDRRAPYMHDGSLSDLQAVVDHYATGGIARPSLSAEMRELSLSAQERADLVTFMQSLTSSDRPTGIATLPR